MLALVGCGDDGAALCDPTYETCLTEKEQKREEQAVAAYNCMPKAVQAEYDALLEDYDDVLDRIYDEHDDDAPQAQIDRAIDSDAEGADISAQLEALREEYLPRVGEECD